MAVALRTSWLQAALCFFKNYVSRIYPNVLSNYIIRSLERVRPAAGSFLRRKEDFLIKAMDSKRSGESLKTNLISEKAACKAPEPVIQEFSRTKSNLNILSVKHHQLFVFFNVCIPPECLHPSSQIRTKSKLRIWFWWKIKFETHGEAQVW